jgi:hypothetical protein
MSGMGGGQGGLVPGPRRDQNVHSLAMAKRDRPPLVCAACDHLIGPRDSFVYRVVDGTEGVWCPGCAPRSRSTSADRDCAGNRETEAATVHRDS